MSETTKQEAPAYKLPQYAQDMSAADRAVFERARAENIEEMLPKTRALLDEALPGLSEERAEEFEALALRIATGYRNNYELGLQQGKDTWGGQSHYAHSFMQNVIENAVE